MNIFLIIINAIQWNDSIKTILISVISSALGVAIAVLIYELIGRRKSHYVEVGDSSLNNEENIKELLTKIALQDTNGVTIYNKRKLAKIEYDKQHSQTNEAIHEQKKTENFDLEIKEEAIQKEIKFETKTKEQRRIFVPKLGYEKTNFYKKLNILDNHVQNRFYEVCDEIVLKKAISVKPNNNQAFEIENKTVAKFDIKGQTLSLYLYNNVKNSSPMKIKIRSLRSVRYSKELIDEIISKHYIKR